MKSEKTPSPPSRRRKRLFVILLPLLLLFLALVLILSTESGFRTALRTADTLSGSVFSVQEVEGRLLSRWRLGKIQVHIDKVVDVQLDELIFSWSPQALLHRKLLLHQIAAQGLVVKVDGSTKEEKEKKKDSPLSMPTIRLPLAVDVEELHLRSGKIFFSEQGKPLLLEEILLQAQARNQQQEAQNVTQVELQRIKLDLRDYAVDLQGRVALHDTWPMQLKGTWQVADPGINDLDGTVDAEGDLDDLDLLLTLISPAQVSLKGKVTGILNDLRWQAAAQSGHFHLKDIKVDVPMDGKLSIVEASGTTGSYQGILAADIHYQGYPPVQAEAKVIADDYTGLLVDYLSVHHGESTLSTRGRMQWTDGFSWQAELEGMKVDPSLLAKEWPGKISGLIQSQGQLSSSGTALVVNIKELNGELAGFPLQGSGGMQLNPQGIEFKELQLQAGSAQAELNGRVAKDNSLDLEIRAESDDLSAFFPEYAGSIHLQGTAIGSQGNPGVQLVLEGSGIEIEGYSLSRIKGDLDADLILEGKESGMKIKTLRLLADKDMSLDIIGQVGWAEGISWQAKLQGNKLNPGLFLPEWPGNITTEIHCQGQKNAETLTAQVLIQELKGSLRDLPLSGSGKAALHNQQILLDNLRLAFGSGRQLSELRVNGSLEPAEQFDLSFTAETEDLAALLPRAGGDFRVQGTLKGKAQQPDLYLTVNAGNMSYEQYRFKQLNAKIKADLSEQGAIDAELKANGIQLKGEKINTAALQIRGSTEQHTLELACDGTAGKARLAATGGLKEQIWQGRLTRLTFDHGRFGEWAMQGPAALRLSGQNAALSDFDLQHKELDISLDGSWKKEGNWQVKGVADNFALQLLQEWQLPVPELKGTAEAKLIAQGRGAQVEQAELLLELPRLSLTTESFKDDEEEVGTIDWIWTDNVLEARLQGTTATVKARTHFQDTGDASFDISAKNCCDLTQPEKIPLNGQLDLNFNDLSPLTHWSNEAVQAAGKFKGRILLGGTVRKPTINGKLALSRGKKQAGEIFFPAAGIGLKDIQIALKGDSSSNEVDAEFSSGPGKIKVSGTARQDAEQHWSVDLALSGKNFQAVDLPEYQAVISPNLHLFYADTETRLSGTLTLNKAKIAPTGFSGAVSSSADVIIVDDDDEEAGKGTSPMYLDLKVIMGEEVMVKTFGLQGFLDGNVKITANPGRPITALGSLDLRDGTFDFEGNMLELNQSRVFYQGGPVDDPGLDILASRKIDKVELGVHLTGTANDMQMRLFSDTAMDESEILSYLLTGQDISRSGNEEKILSPAEATLGKVGGGALLKTVDPLKTLDMEGLVDLSIGGGEDASDVSLVMGKEIYKDLYISYGKDLTGDGGTFKARYDLKYGFSVETATNAKTSGADLFFSIEK